MRSKGYLMTEMLLCVFAMSLLMSLCLHGVRFNENVYYTFPDRYLRLQSESMLTAQFRDESVPEIGYEMHFNGSGNVNLAKELHFPFGDHVKKIIVELGGGRLVFR